MEMDKFRFCIDRGGTFTDVYAEVPQSCFDPRPRVIKLLSEDPEKYDNAPVEGIRRVMSEALGIEIARSKKLDSSMIEWIRMGTTVATNGLLEREGTNFVLVTSSGCADCLEIGNQARSDIFDIKCSKLPPLYSHVIEAKERVRLCSSAELRPEFEQDKAIYGGEIVEIIQPLDEDALRDELLIARKKKKNFSVCYCICACLCLSKT
mmetsp:Transcript_21820/g.33555  ORF Transcript_21820/g.33555 Transcript_21820/m.33555 type:complete len:207 (-) Transcript_21820:3373-3993(-)